MKMEIEMENFIYIENKLTSEVFTICKSPLYEIETKKKVNDFFGRLSRPGINIHYFANRIDELDFVKDKARKITDSAYVILPYPGIIPYLKYESHNNYIYVKGEVITSDNFNSEENKFKMPTLRRITEHGEILEDTLTLTTDGTLRVLSSNIEVYDRIFLGSGVKARNLEIKKTASIKI